MLPERQASACIQKQGRERVKGETADTRCLRRLVPGRLTRAVPGITASQRLHTGRAPWLSCGSGAGSRCGRAGAPDPRPRSSAPAARERCAGVRGAWLPTSRCAVRGLVWLREKPAVARPREAKANAGLRTRGAAGRGGPHPLPAWPPAGRSARTAGYFCRPALRHLPGRHPAPHWDTAPKLGRAWE